MICVAVTIEFFDFSSSGRIAIVCLVVYHMLTLFCLFACCCSSVLVKMNAISSISVLCASL